MTFLKDPNQKFHLSLIFIISILIVLPIAYFGIPDSVDMPQHFMFANTYFEAFKSGDYFVSWADKENFGYGDVGVRFYPPLEYYFLAFLKIIFGNWFTAAWLGFMFWMTLGCFGIYFWTKCWFPSKESAIAAVFYAIIPLHLNQLFVSYNNYSEFAASSLLTFCFAFLTKIFQREKLSDVLGLTLFYALLILTHLPMTLIGSLCLAFYALFLWRKKNPYKPIIKSAIAALISLTATSFYWIIVVTEMKWVNHSTERFSSERFSFEEGFFPAYYHATTFRESVWIYDITAYFTLLFFASTIFYFLYKKRNPTELQSVDIPFRTVLPLGAFAFFMVTPLSNPLWKIITPLQKIQFPTRWFTVVSMCAAIITASSVHFLLKGNFLKQRVWNYSCVIVSAMILLFTFVYILHPTSFVPIKSEKFEAILQELPNNRSFHCWWAIWAKPEAFDITEKVVAGERQTEIISWQPNERVFDVSKGNAGKARIRAFYYPHWKATVNGKEAIVEKDEYGVIIVPIDSDKSTVKVYFEEPLIVKISSIISFLIWLLLGGAILFLIGKKLSFLKRTTP